MKWEYLVMTSIVPMTLIGAHTEWLNKMGAENWELISVVTEAIGERAVFYFKRPVP